MVDALAIIDPVADYDELIKKEEKIRCLWEMFEEEEVCANIVESLEGLINCKLMAFHNEHWDKMESLALDGDLEKAYDLYDKRMEFERAVLDIIDVKPAWRTFITSVAGKQVLIYEAEAEGSESDSDSDSNEEEEESDEESSKVSGATDVVMESGEEEALEELAKNMLGKEDLMSELEDNDIFDMDGKLSAKNTPARGGKKKSSPKVTPKTGNKISPKNGGTPKFKTPTMKNAAGAKASDTKKSPKNDNQEKLASESKSATGSKMKMAMKMMMKMKSSSMKVDGDEEKSQGSSPAAAGGGGKGMKMAVMKAMAKAPKAPKMAMKRMGKMGSGSAAASQLEVDEDMEDEGVPMDVDGEGEDLLSV